MAFALVIIGLLMIVTGAKDTHEQFGAKLVGEFTGPNNFIQWIAAIGIVGSLGYIDQLRVFSRMFMTLIIIVIFLSKQSGSAGGFFEKFSQALNTAPVAPSRTASDTAATGRSMADDLLSGGKIVTDDVQKMIDSKDKQTSRNFADVIGAFLNIFVGIKPAY